MVRLLNSQFVWHVLILLQPFPPPTDVFSRATEQLGSLLKSHTDDVEVRGGARLPRRSLCNEFILLILKTFRPFCVCFFSSPGAALKENIHDHRRLRRSSSKQRLTDLIKAGRRRNARWCLDSTGWEPHKWLMHPRPLHPPVCCRCVCE